MSTAETQTEEPETDDHDDYIWLGPGTWIVDRWSNRRGLGVITDVQERDRDLGARLSIRWHPNSSENLSVLMALERFKSGRWRVDDAY